VTFQADSRTFWLEGIDGAPGDGFGLERLPDDGNRGQIRDSRVKEGRGQDANPAAVITRPLLGEW